MASLLLALLAWTALAAEPVPFEVVHGPRGMPVAVWLRADPAIVARVEELPAEDEELVTDLVFGDGTFACSERYFRVRAVARGVPPQRVRVASCVRRGAGERAGYARITTWDGKRRDQLSDTLACVDPLVRQRLGGELAVVEAEEMVPVGTSGLVAACTAAPAGRDAAPVEAPRPTPPSRSVLPNPGR